MDSFTYRWATEADLPDMVSLVEEVFMAFEAPGYPPEGIAEFMDYIQPLAWAQRMQEEGITLLCLIGGSPAGLIETRRPGHISLLFVLPAYHRQGIATTLWQKILAYSLKRNPHIDHFTVNSSPYALPFYEKCGFKPTEDRQQQNGIIYYPMAFKIKK